MSWINNDGLQVRFGKEEATEGNRGGVVSTDGPHHIMELKVSFADFALSTPRPLNESILTIPSGARIEKVEVAVGTAWASAGAATMSLGSMGLDRSLISNFTYVNQVAVSALTAGAVLTLIPGATGVGTGVTGTATTAKTLICAQSSVAAFTAGTATIRIYLAV